MINFLIRTFIVGTILISGALTANAAGVDPILARAQLSNGSTVTLSANGLTIKASRKATKNGWAMSISGKSASGPFSINYRFKDVADYPDEIMIAELDPSNASPEIMFSAFTGGTHCCAMPVFLEEAGPRNWQIINYPMIDGSPPYFEDIDGDGEAELVTIDQSFLYAFDSYAASYSPMRFEQLRSGKLNEVTRSSSGRNRLRLQIASLESDTGKNAELWNSNGFLAAWVALKSFVGEGKEAWKKMLLLYDRESTFGTYECQNKSVKAFECPSEKLVLIPFPKALELHLKERDYWDKGIDMPD